MLYNGDCNHGNYNVCNYSATWYCHATYLWWKHMGWNPTMDGTMLPIVKSKKRHIPGSWWWSVPKTSLMLWIFSMHICLFAPIMCTMCFYFFMVPIVLLCFRWVHFLWCGYVCWVFWWTSIKDLEKIRRIKGGVVRKSGWAFFSTSFWDVWRDKWQFLAFWRI